MALELLILTAVRPVELGEGARSCVSPIATSKPRRVPCGDKRRDGAVCPVEGLKRRVRQRLQ